MGNTSSERAALERHGGHKTPRRDSSGGAKDGDRPKILMDGPEDADLFHSEEIKAPEKEEFLAWQHDLEVNDKAPAQARPTVFRWTGGGKEVYLSGSFNNWSKLPLTRSHNNFVAILDLPEGEHQYKFFVDGQWTHDPSEPVVTSQLGTVNNVIQVKKTDFEVFDALMVDSQKCSDVSELSSSPPGPYHQEPYVSKPEERFKAPPILPPHLLQVILNKDTGISGAGSETPQPGLKPVPIRDAGAAGSGFTSSIAVPAPRQISGIHSPDKPADQHLLTSTTPPSAPTELSSVST